METHNQLISTKQETEDTLNYTEGTTTEMDNVFWDERYVFLFLSSFAQRSLVGMFRICSVNILNAPSGALTLDLTLSHTTHPRG